MDADRLSPEEIKRRFRRRVIANAIALLLCAPASFVLIEAAAGRETVPGGHGLAWIVVSVVVIVAAATFTIATWRCPACRSSFGNAIYPSTCPQCDVKLR
jgi:hypothetical protein